MRLVDWMHLTAQRYTVTDSDLVGVNGLVMMNTCSRTGRCGSTPPSSVGVD